MRSFWILVAALSFGAGAEAAECPGIAGGSPALLHQDSQVRLEFIRHELSRDGVYAGRWWTGWIATYSALTAVQLGAAVAGTELPASETEHGVGSYLKSSRVQLYEGTATTVVGIASLLISPLRSMWDGPALDLRLSRPGQSDPCADLKDAELMLLRDGDAEATGHSVLIHLGNAALNIAGGLVIGIFFKQWLNGLEAAVIGTAVGEVMILTQPTGSEKALARYRSGDLGQPPPPAVQLEAGPFWLAARF